MPVAGVRPGPNRTHQIVTPCQLSNGMATARGRYLTLVLQE